MAWEEDSCICLNMQLIAILSRIGVDYVIDDADYVVTPDNEWYILDLENKQIDKELKVKVDKDGVWL